MVITVGFMFSLEYITSKVSPTSTIQKAILAHKDGSVSPRGAGWSENHPSSLH
jgi:hypothetical protein